MFCLSEVESWRSEVKVGSGFEDEEEAKVDEGDVEMDGIMEKRDKGKKPPRGPFIPSVEEVHEAFDWIKPIRYHQPLHLGGKHNPHSMS